MDRVVVVVVVGAVEIDAGGSNREIVDVMV